MIFDSEAEGDTALQTWLGFNTSSSALAPKGGIIQGSMRGLKNTFHYA